MKVDEEEMNNINNLNPSTEIDLNSRIGKRYKQLEALLGELDRRDIKDPFLSNLNRTIDSFNANTTNENWKKQVRKAHAAVIKTMSKDSDFRTIHQNRNTWMAVGMAAFGIPLGAAFGAALGNMAFIGIGMPVGMAIGIAVGTAMDKKVKEEGRQLDIELKH